MAEHLNQPRPDHSNDPMHWMGKPVPPAAREYAMGHAKEIGLDSTEAHAVIEGMANALERDKPYEAQGIAMRYVDLTGYYRLLAAILSGTMQLAQPKPPSVGDGDRALQEAIQ